MTAVNSPLEVADNPYLQAFAGSTVSSRHDHPEFADRAANGHPPDGVERRTRARNNAGQAAHHDAIYTLARASELHDEDTGNHVLRIRAIVRAIAIKMNFTAEDADSLGYDAMLHDVGKLTIPPSILKKPDALTTDERAIMESHTTRGEDLLGARPSMRRAARIARSHHEAWDGTGYPDGLRGDAIPIEARITSAADVFDALVSTRCYKQAWSYEQAFQEVVRLSGSRLDPAVIASLESCNRNGDLSAIFRLSARCAMP